MREILFRAKRIDNGEWVEGLPQKMWGEWHIINTEDENTAYPIDPETICQYTGITDKNGKRIWENDILVEKHRGRIHYIFKVVWDAEEGSWMCESKFDSKYGIGIINSSKFEKIGNIFDNPEMLKED